MGTSGARSRAGGRRRSLKECGTGSGARASGKLERVVRRQNHEAAGPLECGERGAHLVMRQALGREKLSHSSTSRMPLERSASARPIANSSWVSSRTLSDAAWPSRQTRGDLTVPTWRAPPASCPCRAAVEQQNGRCAIGDAVGKAELALRRLVASCARRGRAAACDVARQDDIVERVRWMLHADATAQMRERRFVVEQRRRTSPFKDSSWASTLSSRRTERWRECRGKERPSSANRRRLQRPPRVSQRSPAAAQVSTSSLRRWKRARAGPGAEPRDDARAFAQHQEKGDDQLLDG